MNFFVKGPITQEHINQILAEQSKDHQSGAFTIFLGQVRDDKIAEKEVAGIEYTAYEDMALQVARNITEDSLKQFELNKVIILHSLDYVKAGEISLFVLVAAGHRPNVFTGCSHIVERIKKELPVWGKEIFGDTTYTWKKNKF